ncbi:MAG: hypothetical protein ACYSUV_02030 [Planctomycetota bacterium]|jgi:hypothetical protein
MSIMELIATAYFPVGFIVGCCAFYLTVKKNEAPELSGPMFLAGLFLWPFLLVIVSFGFAEKCIRDGFPKLNIVNRVDVFLSRMIQRLGRERHNKKHKI